MCVFVFMKINVNFFFFVQMLRTLVEEDGVSRGRFFVDDESDNDDGDDVF